MTEAGRSRQPLSLSVASLSSCSLDASQTPPSDVVDGPPPVTSGRSPSADSQVHQNTSDTLDVSCQLIEAHLQPPDALLASHLITLKTFPPAMRSHRQSMPQLVDMPPLDFTTAMTQPRPKEPAIPMPHGEPDMVKHVTVRRDLDDARVEANLAQAQQIMNEYVCGQKVGPANAELRSVCIASQNRAPYLRRRASSHSAASPPVISVQGYSSTPASVILPPQSVAASSASHSQASSSLASSVARLPGNTYTKQTDAITGSGQVVGKTHRKPNVTYYAVVSSHFDCSATSVLADMPFGRAGSPASSPTSRPIRTSTMLLYTGTRQS